MLMVRFSREIGVRFGRRMRIESWFSFAADDSLAAYLPRAPLAGGDGGGSNSPSRKIPVKASTCVAVGCLYRFRTMPTASATGHGCRLPLDVLPALHIRTSDIRRPTSASENNSCRTSLLFKQ